MTELCTGCDALVGNCLSLEGPQGEVISAAQSLRVARSVQDLHGIPHLSSDLIACHDMI